MRTRYDEPIDRLREAALPGSTPPSAMESYLETVRRHAYRVTDLDVERLKQTGISEDEIFERTVAAAVAAGLERREAALRVLG